MNDNELIATHVAKINRVSPAQLPATSKFLPTNCAKVLVTLKAACAAHFAHRAQEQDAIVISCNNTQQL